MRHYFGETLDGGFTWPTVIIPWVVTSLGAPLSSVFLDTGKPAPPAMTIVVDDGDLEPLKDDDPPAEKTDVPVLVGAKQ